MMRVAVLVFACVAIHVVQVSIAAPSQEQDCKIGNTIIPAGQRKRLPPPSCATCSCNGMGVSCSGFALLNLPPKMAAKCEVLTCNCKRYVVDKLDRSKACEGTTRAPPIDCLSCPATDGGARLPFNTKRPKERGCGYCRNSNGHCSCDGLPLPEIPPKMADKCEVLTCNCKHNYVVSTFNRSMACEGTTDHPPIACLSCPAMNGGARLPFNTERRMLEKEGCGYCWNRNGHCSCVGNPVINWRFDPLCKKVPCGCETTFVSRADPSKKCRSDEPSGLKKSCYNN